MADDLTHHDKKPYFLDTSLWIYKWIKTPQGYRSETLCKAQSFDHAKQVVDGLNLAAQHAELVKQLHWANNSFGCIMDAIGQSEAEAKRRGMGGIWDYCARDKEVRQAALTAAKDVVI